MKQATHYICSEQALMAAFLNSEKLKVMAVYPDGTSSPTYLASDIYLLEKGDLPKHYHAVLDHDGHNVSRAITIKTI